MKRGTEIIMILSLFMLLIGGCSPNEEVTNQNEFNFIGNDTNSIANGGYVAKQGDWVLYYDSGNTFSIGEGLYKIKTDGSNEKRIASGAISNINIAGDWVFYVQATKKRGTSQVYQYQLFKVKLDGSEKKKVLDDCSGVNIVGNRIYYMVCVDEMGYRLSGISDYPLKEQLGNIYYLNLDTGEKVKVVDKNAYGYVISGENIIYLDDTGIYRVDADGNKEDFLLFNKEGDIRIDGDLLYYINYDHAKRESIINVLDINNKISQKIIIPGLQILDLCIGDKTLMFISSNAKLYEMSKDGTGLQEVNNEILKIYSLDSTLYGWNGKLLMNIRH